MLTLTEVYDGGRLEFVKEVDQIVVRDGIAQIGVIAMWEKRPVFSMTRHTIKRCWLTAAELEEIVKYLKNLKPDESVGI